MEAAETSPSTPKAHGVPWPRRRSAAGACDIAFDTGGFVSWRPSFDFCPATGVTRGGREGGSGLVLYCCQIIVGFLVVIKLSSMKN